MARTTRRVLLLAAVALLVGGCLAPTLPLPPPSKPTVAGPDESGNVELTGSVQPNSEVYVRNYASTDIYGQVTGNDGAYDLTLPAQVGDELEFWYESGKDQSPSIIFQIRAP